MQEFEYNELDVDRAKAAIRELLIAIGEDPDREGLLETPTRVARAYAEVFSGLHEDPSAHLRMQFHEANHEEMVIVKDIPFTSMCEHHLLPFRGRVHVAYIPSKGCVTGLSKIARCVEGYARRLQVQERMTSQIADAVMEALNPLGAFVVIEAEHMCMTARGIRKPGSMTVTSAVRGSFKVYEKTRREALSLFEA